MHNDPILLTFEIPGGEYTISLPISGYSSLNNITVDWGDGTIDSGVLHLFSFKTPILNEYIINNSS